MWNQSAGFGSRSREICPPGVNWLGDAGYNYHLSQSRIIVERVFGKLKARFKVLDGVTDRRAHTTNARMICAAVILHNLLIGIGDKPLKGVNDYEVWKQARHDSRQVMAYFEQTGNELKRRSI
ncbi:Hypothetical protein PHPALM_8575 [Phytophthora palmivora]|uniref:DDE Tnp4 domain-containing protein n=1 Tax=Phytophthora palmivora TaxID=4796 RepID=A0A2P4Y9G7_9STRA|nr:Hypothetical protein PHPALM_8575 [Phytophthora palmivora]